MVDLLWRTQLRYQRIACRAGLSFHLTPEADMQPEIIYCVMAWPTGGFSEMMVEACDTCIAAEAVMRTKEARHPRWSFRIAEHVST